MPVPAPVQPAIEVPQSADDWRRLIQLAPAATKLVAVQFQRKVADSYSHPYVVMCDDGQEYVVKSLRSGQGDPDGFRRSLVNEQVVGWLGKKAGGPIPPVQIVDVTPALIAINGTIADVTMGLSHGSYVLPSCHGSSVSGARQWGTCPQWQVSENRPRLASIALLYGMFAGSDHQLIYADDPPHLVWSVDHGHFFCGPKWTVESLAQTPLPQPVVDITTALTLSAQDFRDGALEIEVLTPIDVAAAVRRPPDDWGLTVEERIVLASFIWRRRCEILELVSKLK